MSQLTLSFETLTEPRNQMAHLLYDLIQGEYIAEQSYSYNRFRGYMSDLRLKYNLPIRHVDVPFVNKFGRDGRYRKHFLLSLDREQAIEVYNKINL